MNIKRGNTVLADVYLKDNSYVVEEVMGEYTLTLNFLSRKVLDIQINDYVEFEGGFYKIRHNEKVTKRETSLGWEYNVTFYSSRYSLQDVEFFLHGKPERKKNFDAYTGTARQVLELIVKNMNRVETGWTSGSCIESRAETFTFKDKKVGSVLDEVVKAFETEYWISGKTISIGKRQYDSNGLVLGQGPGMGFTELEVSAVDDTPPVTVLYPYGSDKNLSIEYGSDYLLLPGGKLSIEKNVDKYGRIEKSMPFDHIFPKGEFTVTEKIDTLTLKAAGIDFDITAHTIDEQEVIVTFQDGGLAGYDLAIVDKSWDNATKQFKLKENKEENALTVPGDINFSVGDKFILTNLKMPQSYIDKASAQLQEESSKWLDEHCEKRIQLRGKCDDVLFRQQSLFISCGQMVGIVSEELKIDREIRVTRVKRYIENDNEPTYRYELTLSDFLQSNGFKDMVDDVNKMPEEIEDKVKPVREYSKRSWRDVKETQDMMFDPDGSFQTEFTSSLMAEFAHLLVGSKSQQMDLMGIKFIPNADNDPNYFKSTVGKLVHFTIRESIAEWTIPSSAHRLSNSIAYYVYAKCSRTTSNGSIYVTDQKIKLEEDREYYHFWIGVLNTPEDNVRSWGPLYGYTEIAGQTITTGVIKDKLARLVIDLVNAKITANNGATIEGKIKFTSGSSGLYNTDEWPSISGDINDAYGMGYNAFQKAGTASDKATAAEKAATDKSAEAEKTAKNNLAYMLGFKDYAAMVAAGRLSSVLIDGGVISAAVVNAAAIVTKGLSAEMIQALDIVTGKLTVTTGAKIADFTVDEGQLKYVGSNYGSKAKIRIGNVESGNPDTSNALITAFGIDAAFDIAGSSATTTGVKNALIDNVATPVKKTSLIIKTAGGAKNTALAVYGNLTVTGSIGERYIHLIRQMPNSTTGYDHNHVFLAGSQFTLPSTTEINDWFGDDPSNWRGYHGGEGGINIYGYDLHVAVARWQTGNITVYGNPVGGDGVADHPGTQLHGEGVQRASSGSGRYGYLLLRPGDAGVFRLNRGCWYYFGSHA